MVIVKRKKISGGQRNFLFQNKRQIEKTSSHRSNFLRHFMIILS